MEISLRILFAISFEKVKRIDLNFKLRFSSFRSEQQTIDIERELRYNFMCERTEKEMPVERQFSL